MRLDHLLSKENRVFVLLLGWVLVSTWLVTVFCRRMWVLRVVARFFRWETAAHTSCVWFWELMKQELFAVFQPLLVVKVFAEQQMCLCLVCDGLFCFVACCWVSRAARLLFYKITPFGEQDLLLVVAHWFWAACGWVLCVGWCVV